MRLRLPDSGSWLSAALHSLGHPVGVVTENSGIEQVNEAQVIEALAAMARGDIEYVILEEGEAFLQAAGDSDGPYQLQFRASGTATMVEVAGGVDGQTLRQLWLAYRRGDASWRDSQVWTDTAE